MDLTLKTGEGLFNHRVAAVIVWDNKILAQKNTDTNEYYLPGGRVSFGESSADAVIREIREELKITVKDYKPLWINECFFIDSGKNSTNSAYIIRLVLMKRIFIILSLFLRHMRTTG